MRKSRITENARRNTIYIEETKKAEIVPDVYQKSGKAIFAKEVGRTR